MTKIYNLLGVLLTVATLVPLKAQNNEATALKTETKPGYWMIPNSTTQIKFGGYVKLDMIYDFNPIGNPDVFDVTTIATDGSTGATSNLNAKETRLHVDVITPTKVGNVRAYIEGDFYGSGGAFRMRHAFVDINDKIRAGQWWSNFMDESMIPSTLDFEKPGAYAFARHPMLRFKHNMGDAYLAFAFEQVTTKLQTPAEPGEYRHPIPDITGRYRLTKDWGHVQLSVFYAQVKYQLDAGGSQSTNEYGANLSGMFRLFEKDELIYQGLYGPGVGRYRGDLTAGLDENGELEAITGFGVTIGYKHFWSDDFSSVFVYNQGGVDPTAGEPGSNGEKINYMAINLLWHFVPKGLVGIEYLRGNLELINEDDGTANRIQCSVKYSF